MGVLIACFDPVSLTTFSRVLMQKVTILQNIILGPMRSLLKFESTKSNSPIILCHKSLRDYLMDMDIERSHRFFVPSADADAVFINILSHQPSTGRSYSAHELRTFLAVVMLSLPPHTQDLGLDPLLVERVVLGPLSRLSNFGSDHTIRWFSSSLDPFLCDTNRSGNFVYDLKT